MVMAVIVSLTVWATSLSMDAVAEVRRGEWVQMRDQEKYCTTLDAKRGGSPGCR